HTGWPDSNRYWASPESDSRNQINTDLHNFGAGILNRRIRNWRRTLLWINGVLTVVLTVIFIGLFVLLQNHSFQHYVLKVVHQEILDATGINLQMKDFSLHLDGLSPSVDLYNVVVEAAPPYNDAPVLQIDHLSVGVTIISLIRHTWYLNDVTIYHPVARIVIDEQGNNNLPSPKNNGSKTSVFDLGVRHVHVVGGEIYYNDHENSLQADLRNLRFQSSFDPGPKRYFG